MKNPTVLRRVALFLGLAALAGCSNRAAPPEVRLALDIPAFAGAGKIPPTPKELWPVAKSGKRVPKDLASMDCFFVSVSGVGIPPSFGPTGKNSPSSVCLGLGVVSPFASVGDLESSGATLSLNAGSSRKIQIFGVVSNSTATKGCTNKAFLPDFMGQTILPELYLVGGVDADVFKDTKIQITSTYNPGKATDLMAQCFALEPPACTLTASPDTVPVGALLTLTIATRDPITSATIDGAPVTAAPWSVTVTPSTTGTATSTATVTSPGGTGSCKVTYQVTAALPPVVSAVFPSSGTYTGGTVVTIVGSSFQTGASATFGGAACTALTVVSPNQIVCTAPNGTGSADVVVTNPGPLSGTLAGGFMYVPLRVLTVIPSSGPSAGGPINVFGTSFDTTSAVTVGGAACISPVLVSSQQINCIAPVRAAGPQDVVVTNTSVAASATLTGGYTYLADPAPAIYAVSPASGSSVGGTTINVFGANFLSGAILSVAGTACTTTFVSTSVLSCATPAHAAGPADIKVVNPGGATVTLVGGYQYLGAPSVASFFPASGSYAGGTTLFINGSGFQAGAVVFVGGNSCSAPVVNSPTQMTCTTQGHAATPSASVVVQNLDLQSGTAASTFAYQDVSITAVSPAGGPAAGGTGISIFGTSFAGAATVNVGSSPCTGLTVVSSSQIECTTPQGTGSVAVAVDNHDTHNATKPGAFLYAAAAAPSVVTVSPSVGPAGGNTPVKLLGSGFATSGGAVGVSICTTLSIVVDSQSQIHCVTKPGSGATDVVVTNPDGQPGTLPLGFTYQAAPTVTSVSPASGTYAAGTFVNITGTGFVSGAKATFGGTQCTGPAVLSSTNMICNAPGGTPGPAVDVVVTNPDTQAGTGSGKYTYVALAVTGASPSIGPTTGGTTISIYGSSFDGGAQAKVNNTNCISQSVVSSSRLDCVTPNGPAGPVAVQVQNSDATTASANVFTYVPTPVPTSVSQPKGLAAGGDSITISSTTPSFVNITSVSICAPPLAVTSTSIGCTTKPGSGTVDVVVTNSLGQSGTLAGAFTYIAAPTVGGVTPGQGSYLGGTNLQIQGTGFDPSATVLVGGTGCASLAFVSPTLLLCTTPAGTVAVNVPVKVTNPLAQSTTVTSFNYVDIAVNNVVPPSGSPQGGTTINIFGQSFSPVAVVKIGVNNCTSTIFVSPNQITCVTPQGSPGSPGLTVTNPDSHAAGSGFTYLNSPPTVTKVVPAFAVSGGGTPLTIQGTGFFQSGPTKPTVPICGSPLVVVDQNNITCPSAALPTGDTNVTVTNPDGQAATLPAGINIVGVPTVTQITPNTGSTGGGTIVSVVGTNFGPGFSVGIPDAGHPCAVVSVTLPTQFQCQTAAQLAGQYNFVVKNTDSTTATVPAGFTYGSDDTWLSFSTPSVPEPRFGHSAVWTGQYMVVWGGRDNNFSPGPLGLYNTGGRYDPTSDSWSTTSAAPGVPTARHHHTAVWTGTEMIVWGGGDNGTGVFSDGARYNPVGDGWSAMAPFPGNARKSHTAVWTGTSMIVWGGDDGSNTLTGILQTGGVYIPPSPTESWTATSTTSVPSGRVQHTAIWTGQAMVVWGGMNPFIRPGTPVNTGGVYTPPPTESWTPTSTGQNVPLARIDHTAVWTGAQMIVWGGDDNAANTFNNGAKYNPQGDTWAVIADLTTRGPGPLPLPHKLHSAVWSGKEMIIWGGQDASSAQQNTGARYNPNTNSWTPTVNVRDGWAGFVPGARYNHTAVWTGRSMLIWGGNDSGAGPSFTVNTGGQYIP